MATSGRKRKREIQEENRLFIRSPNPCLQNIDSKKRRVSDGLPSSYFKERAIDVPSWTSERPLGLQRHLSLRSSGRSLRSLALASWTSPSGHSNSSIHSNTSNSDRFSASSKVLTLPNFSSSQKEPSFSAKQPPMRSKEALLLHRSHTTIPRAHSAWKEKSASSLRRRESVRKSLSIQLEKGRSSLRRNESLRRLRKPIVNLRGSMRLKMAANMRRSLMRGKQDYNLALASTVGQMDFVRFMGAMQPRDSSSSQEDQELQQKIDFEIKMRDGTAKLLAASRHPYQLLEAAKNLLTSNTRMISYMSELQRRKTDEVMKRNSSEAAVSTPCTGTLSISDIRVPLMWKDTDYFKNKGDHRRFAVFCLLKIGTEIYDTSLVKDVDRSMPDITFDDVIVFNKVSPDFELQVEVYSHRLCDDLTMASTPRKIKKKINEISSSVGRSVGRRLSGLREDPEFFGHMIVGPKFECIADATLSLKDVSENIHTYDLVLENNSIDAAHTELPLFGNFCCRLAGQPQCMSEPVRAGALSARLSKESESAEYWASLKAGSLSCMCTESSDSTEADSTTCDNTPSEDTPTLTIPINKNTQIVKKILSDVSCIEVTNSNLRIKTRHILTFDSDRDLEGWLKALQQHVLDHVSWRHVTDASMQMKPPTPQKAPVFLRKGTQSLYQTSACDSPMTLVLKRLNVDPKSPKSGDLNSSTTSGEGGENVKSSPALTPPVMRRKGRTRLNNCGPALSLDETSSGGFSYDYNRNSESSVTTASGSSKYSSTATITSAETEASEEEAKRATRSTSKTSLASTQS